MSKQPVTISLQGCLELFIYRCETENLSQATIQFYNFNIGRFIRYLSSEQNIINPTVQDYKVEYIKMYLKKARNSKKWESHALIKTKNESIGSQSVRTYARALRSFGNWLFNNGFIKENILELLKLPKASDSVKMVLNDSEISEVMEHFNSRTELGLRNLIIFTLAYDVGIRQGGIVNVNIDDVDLHVKTVRVRLKGGNSTILPLGKVLVKQIREYLLKYRGAASKSEPLLVDRFGNQLSENAVKKMFSKLKESTGIQRIHCHLGRHTFACNYVDEGKHSIKELQLALGHESDTVSKKYVHLAERITYVRNGADSHFDRLMEAENQKSSSVRRRKSIEKYPWSC